MSDFPTALETKTDSPVSSARTETHPAAHAADYAKAEINRSLSAEEKIRFLREMMRIRKFEQTALKYYNHGQMGGFLHLYIGQESVAVGTLSLLGKNTGCSKGKGGSMHFFAPDKNFWGGHGIVAGQTPLGLGIAFGLKYKGLTGAALC